MRKLMFTLAGEHVGAALHHPALHGALAEAGVTRLQVNVDDEHVRAAMRIATSAPPIAALLSVWTSTDPATVVTSLAGVADRVAGWEVEEHRPIAPPEVWDGSRVDTLANVAVLRRPAELSREEWLHRWLVDHTPVAIATQATFGYVQNLVLAPVTADAPPVDAFVEELFAMAAIDDMHVFYGTGGDDAVLDDHLTRLMLSVARIGADRDLDLVPTSRYLYSWRCDDRAQRPGR